MLAYLFRRWARTWCCSSHIFEMKIVKTIKWTAQPWRGKYREKTGCARQIAPWEEWLILMRLSIDCAM